MLFDLKTVCFLRPEWLSFFMLNVEKDWGDSEEAKIFRGGGGGGGGGGVWGVAGVIQKVDNTISCMSSENEA